MQRPPYLRWAGAAALILGALLWDLRGSATEAVPFAAADIEAGAQLSDADIDWKQVSAGTVRIPDLAGKVTAVRLQAGDPITSSALQIGAIAPEGWWEIPVPIGSHAAAGDRVMLVVADPPLMVEGLVLAPQTGDAFSLNFQPAIVAVPPAEAPLIAAAAAENRIVAAVRR